MFRTVLESLCGFKGTVAPGFVGPFWPSWIGLAKKKNLYYFLLLLRFLAAILKFMYRLFPKHLAGSWNLRDGFNNVGNGSRRFPISFSENYRVLARCKFFSMNLRLINIFVDGLADVFPFVSSSPRKE